MAAKETAKNVVCLSEHICLCETPCPGYSNHNPGTRSKAEYILERALETGDWTTVIQALRHVDDCPHFQSQLKRRLL